MIKTKSGCSSLDGLKFANVGDGMEVPDRWDILNDWANHALVHLTFSCGQHLKFQYRKALTWTALYKVKIWICVDFMSHLTESTGDTSYFSSNPFREDGCTSLWQTAHHSWTSYQCTNWSDSCVYPSPKASVSTPDGYNEAKQEAMLRTRGTTCISTFNQQRFLQLYSGWNWTTHCIAIWRWTMTGSVML